MPTINSGHCSARCGAPFATPATHEIGRTPARVLVPSLVRRVSLVASLAVCFAASLTAQRQKPWNAMDYGPYQTATVSCADPANITHKGVAIKLSGSGDSKASLLFDTELLRVSAAWTGAWLKLRGTPYDGGHGSWCGIDGREVTATPRVAGWSRSASFTDPRSIPHGSLPRSIGRYRGLWLHGDRVTVGYDIFGTRVLETGERISVDGEMAIARDLEIGRTESPLYLLVHAGRSASMREAGGILVATEAAPKPAFVSRERAEGAWTGMRIGAPSSRDYADASRGKGVTMRAVDGFAPAQGPKLAKGASLAVLQDGRGPRNSDDVQNNHWFDRSRQHRKGRILIDLKASVELQRFHVFSWHRAERAPQNWRLFGSNADSAPKANAKRPEKAGWKAIGKAETRDLGRAGKHAVALAETDGSAIGRFRWLLLETEPKGTANGTFLSEIDIWTSGDDERWTPTEVPAQARGFALLGDTDGVRFEKSAAKDQVVLRIDPAASRKLRVVAWRGAEAALGRFRALVAKSAGHGGVARYTEAGPRRWKQSLETKGVRGRDDGSSAYVVDTITTPETNPWKSRLRFGAFDFFKGGDRAALCTWNGDVWIVDGILSRFDSLRWTRFATGIFEPLGLLIEDDKVMVHGRDGVTRLHDTNGDGEADYYECFNNDVYVTKGFHEFAFDLQRGPKGSYFMSKGGPVNAGGRGFMKITPHAGTILELSADGEKLSVYATGLRAPIGVGPDGQITSGDNEGTWMPRCRLNWIKRGSFNGCVPLAHRAEAPTSYDPPLCWLPFAVDNSSGGQVWVPDDRWGPMKGELLHLSYGQCKIYRVLRQEVDGVMQGGIAAMPMSFASSCMRARFSPADGQMYVVGFRGWQTRATRLTAFQRVRRGKGALRMPSALRVVPGGVEIDFTCALDPETANDPESYSVQAWNYQWTSRYGSPEVSFKDPTKLDKKTGSYNRAAKPAARDSLVVKSAKLLGSDGKRVRLEIPELTTVMQMEISFNLDAADEEVVRGAIWNTIHKVPSGR